MNGSSARCCATRRERNLIWVTFAIANKRIWVAGHRGMLGQALVRRLGKERCEVLAIERAELDLEDQSAVGKWISEHCPDAIIVSAGHVGGVQANRDAPVDFLARNVSIALNIIQSAHKAGVDRLVYVGSAAAYPMGAAQPIAPDALLTGPLDATHRSYGIAKIVGVALCQAYRDQYNRDYVSVMPCNLYGPGGNADAMNGHVIASLLRRFDEAKNSGAPQVTLWGTGTPRRQFLHVDDCADAIVMALARYHDGEPLNLASEDEVTIAELAGIIADTTGFKGLIAYDSAMPDGAPRRALDGQKLHEMGWRPSIRLVDGIADLYRPQILRKG